MTGSKQQVFYIHGGESYTKYDSFLQRLRTKEIRNLPTLDKFELWSKSLPVDLGNKFSVFTPQMPNSDNAKYEEWKIWFERHFQYFDEGIILVGWSLGAMFLLKYLSENNSPLLVKALILIAPAYYYFVDPETGEDGGDFNCTEANISNISKNNVEQTIIFHSQDDYIIPFDHSEKLKVALPEAELVTFTDRNHFLQPEFPELVAKIKEIAGE